jgi:hypothetical protein
MVVCKPKPGHNCLCIRDELVGLQLQGLFLVEEHHQTDRSIQRHCTSTSPKWSIYYSTARPMARQSSEILSPRIYPYLKNQNMTLEQTDLVDLFLPLWQQAYDQFLQLLNTMQSVLTSEEIERWTYI